jgi:hypothetical protein
MTAGRGADGVGMVDIPDERLDRLTEAVKPAKKLRHSARRDSPPGVARRARRVRAAG